MSENEYPTHGDFCVACDENLSVICERCYKDLITKLTEARAEVARLRERVTLLEWNNEAGCENTPTRGCECPGCMTARERAKGEP
jgi:hypothetical protein